MRCPLLTDNAVFSSLDLHQTELIWALLPWLHGENSERLLHLRILPSAAEVILNLFDPDKTRQQQE